MSNAGEYLVAGTLGTSLVKDVGKLGNPAVFAAKSLAVETNNLLIKGQFISVDEWNGRR